MQLSNTIHETGKSVISTLLRVRTAANIRERVS